MSHAPTDVEIENAHFRAAFDHAAIGMVMADADGRIILVNDAFARMVGRKREELIGRDSTHFTHPDDRDLTRINVQRATGFEKRYVKPDGTAVWARITLSAAGDYLVGTAEDITEQIRTREQLIETRRKLSSALIAGEVATYEWDVNSDRLWGDANFDQIFGTERDTDGTAPLERFVEAIHPDDRERVMAAVNHTVATGADYDIEYRVMNPPIERWVSARGRLERDDEHGIVRFHGVVLDITARKRAEEELQRRSRLYDTFLSGTDDLAYLIDREGRFIFANRALLELWGMTLEQVNGKTLYDLGYPKWHADMNMREFAQILETKKTIRGQVPYTSPTGVSGLYEYVFSPVLDECGEVELIAGTSRDATERRKAAEMERRLAEQLRLALEAANMGWWQFDPATGVVFLDERTRAIFGIAGSEERYEDLVARMPHEDAAAIEKAIKAATDPRDPQPYDVEYRLRMDDGSTRWFASKGLATFEGDGDGRHAVRFVGTVLDVTEAKKAQQALQASAAHLRQLADAMTQLVWTADADGRVDTANKTFFEYTGIPPGPFDENAWVALVYPDDLDGLMTAYRNAIASGTPFEHEVRFRRTDGMYRWFVSRAVPVVDAVSGERRWFGTSTDVHEQRMLLEQNRLLLESERAARTESERAGRMKDEFLATLSHELRTPLSAILGWAQILGGGGNTDEEVAEGIAVIARNARAQKEIIEDLLEMSRIVSGKIRLDVQPVVLADVVNAAIDTVRAAASAKRVSIDVEADDATLRIRGDVNRLQQVFWNLLSNAVKFTPNEGSIRVRTARVASHIEVSVSDTGEGIRPEFLPYVFDRFRQADATTTRRHGGLGLGLAIVKQLSELHGGWVRVASDGPGKGATFTVALPLVALRQEADVERRRSERDRAHAVADMCGKVRGLRVLIVDDESDSRGVVQRFLEDCEMNVTTAAAASEALSLLKARDFDVLVSDIGMPGEDGFTLIGKLRTAGNPIPAIALTAYARPEDRVRAVRAGFQAHLAKPADPTELVAIVASLAGRR